MIIRKFFLLFFLYFLAFSLDAEALAELYTNLDEKTANRILFVLLKNNVEAEKVLVDKDLFKISIDETKIARSLKLLEEEGLPGRSFVDIRELFKNEGLVSSPLQEKARYVYAISQTIEETISNIDGIITARIHIVLPTENVVGELIFPSSAAVFVKYKNSFNIPSLVPKLKRLIADSIEGLSYDKVSVVLFEKKVQDIHDIPLQPASKTWLWVVVSLFLILILVVVAVLVYFFWYKPDKNRRTEENSLKEKEQHSSKEKFAAFDTADKRQEEAPSSDLLKEDEFPAEVVEDSVPDEENEENDSEK